MEHTRTESAKPAFNKANFFDEHAPQNIPPTEKHNVIQRERERERERENYHSFYSDGAV